MLNVSSEHSFNIIKPGVELKYVYLSNAARQFKEGDEVWIRKFSIGNKWIPGTILCCTCPLSYNALTEKGIVKKHKDHLRKKESPIKDEIYPEVQLEKRGLHQNETTVNSPVTANNPLQNITDPSTQKQLRIQINNVPKSANDVLIEPQPVETNLGNSGGGGDSSIVLRRSQRERRPPKYLKHYESWSNEYRNGVEKRPKVGVVS